MNDQIEAIPSDLFEEFKSDSFYENIDLIICNPPYGERIGKDEDLEKLYYDYGENLKNCFKGFRAYIFTGNTGIFDSLFPGCLW